MLKKMKTEHKIFTGVMLLILVVAIFWPRQRNLLGVSLSAHLGNLGGRLSFEAFENQDHKGKMMVLFYAPWCGHCKKMMPEWDQFMEESKDGDVMVVKVNADEDKELAEKHGVKSFPTIKFYSNGLDSEAEEYDGNRTASAFMEFVKNK